MDFAILSSSVIVYAIEVFLITGILSLAAALFSRFFIRNAAMRHAVLGSGLLAVAMTPAVLWFMPTSIRIPVAHFNSFIEPTALKVEAIARNEQPERSSTKLIPMSCSSVASQSTDHNDTTAPSNSSVSCSSTASVQDPSSNEQDSSKVDSIARPSLSNLDRSPVAMSSSLSVRTEASAGFDWALAGRFWLQLAISIWMVGSLLLVARMARGLWMVHRMIVASTAWKACDRERVWLQQKFSRGIIPEIRISTGIASPLLVGWLRGVILLPAHLQEKLTANQWREILLHETAHWERRDHWMVMIERILVALLWPQVFVQVLCKELGRSREELCDNLVLSVCDPLSYAKTLLQVAESSVIRSVRYASVGFLIRKEEFKNRVAAIIDSKRSRMLAVRPLVGYSAIAVAAIGTILVCSVTMQTGVAEHPDDESETTVVHRNEELASIDKDLVQSTLRFWSGSIDVKKLEIVAQQRYLGLLADVDLTLAQEVADLIPKAKTSSEELLVLRKLVEDGKWDVLDVKTRSINKNHIQWWLYFWKSMAAQGRYEKNLEIVERSLGKIRELAAMIDDESEGMLIASVAFAEFVVLDARVELLHDLIQGDQEFHPEYSSRLTSSINAMNRCAGNIPLLSSRPSIFFNPSETIGHMRDYLALESWDRPPHPDLSNWDLTQFEYENFGAIGKFESKEVRVMNLRRNQLIPSPLVPKISWRTKVPTTNSPMVYPWMQRQFHIGNHDAVLAYAMTAMGDDQDFVRLLAILIRALSDKEPEKGKSLLSVLQKTIETLPAETNRDRVEALLEASIACFSLNEIPTGKVYLDDALRHWPTDDKGVHDLYAIALDALSFIDFKEYKLPFDLHKGVANRSHIVREMERSLSNVFEAFKPPSGQSRELAKYKSLIAAKAWREASEECVRLQWTSSLIHIGSLSAEDMGLEATLEWTKSIENMNQRFMIEIGALHQKMKRAEPFETFFSYPSYVPKSLVPGIKSPSAGC